MLNNNIDIIAIARELYEAIASSDFEAVNTIQAELGAHALAEALITRTSDVHEAPIFKAANKAGFDFNKFMEFIECLEAPIDARDSNGNTLLHILALSKPSNLVEYLTYLTTKYSHHDIREYIDVANRYNHTVVSKLEDYELDDRLEIITDFRDTLVVAMMGIHQTTEDGQW